ncbi:hypothetical protein L218DRAFT_856241, partial [Marasmius fiardii PR-910]
KDGTGTLYLGSGVPMDIDQYKHEGCCFDCGEKGHIGRNCPQKGNKDKKFTV